LHFKQLFVVVRISLLVRPIYMYVLTFINNFRMTHVVPPAVMSYYLCARYTLEAGIFSSVCVSAYLSVCASGPTEWPATGNRCSLV